MSNRDHFDSGRTGQPIPVTDGVKPKVKPATGPATRPVAVPKVASVDPVSKTLIKPASKPATRPTFVPKPKPEPKPDKFLGVAVNRGKGQNNNVSVYDAEELWHKTSPLASRELDRLDAQGLAENIINHPSMDSIPGIEDIRANFKPSQISFHKQLQNSSANRFGRTLGSHYSQADSMIGHINQLQFSTGVKPRHPQGRIKLGVLTHELSHYILDNSDTSVPGDHNWAMARLHLHILKNVLSSPRAYKDLKQAYDNHGVNYGERVPYGE